MDKETLSNYGWVVICVIVLAIMITLATPFGNEIKEAVVAATERLMGIASDALSAIDTTTTTF